ncbi:MAG: insulinase family protein [Cyanobacteria bacterium SZAS TMP-1]|nr:insulinase family protein [Cyanobacteria bacterium SZAS TMP-1]
MIRTTTLPNGARIVTEVVDSVYSAAIDLWLKVGSAYETELNNGVSHCIEHMLFKGTATRSAERIAEEIEDVGGTLGASTSKELTKVYGHVLGEALPTALDIITDMVTNPLLKKADLSLEKSVILDEMQMYEDDAADVAQEITYANIWQGYAHSYPITGTVDTVNGIDAAMLREHYERFYRPERMVVSIAGNFDEEATIKFLSEKLGALKPGTAPKMPVTPRSRLFNVVRDKDVEQAQLMLVCEGLNHQDKRLTAMQVLDLCLASSASSRLFKEIRERRGLVYNIASSQHAYVNCGLISIYAAMSPANTETVLRLVLQELNRLKSEGFTAAEIARAKTQLRTDLLMDLESMSARSTNNAADLIHYDRLIPLAEAREEIEAVTNEDVIALAQELFAEKKLSLVVVGPAEELREHYNLSVVDK